MGDRLVDGHAIDPSAPARFGRLEPVARLVVEGLMAGMHTSPLKGVSVAFAEHRQYGPGDEIRHIDWRAFGKSDRYSSPGKQHGPDGGSTRGEVNRYDD